MRPAEGYIGSPLLALRRIVLFLGLTLVLMPLQAVLLPFHARLAKRLPFWYHRQGCRCLGVRVERRGRPRRQHPTLFVCNHVSYFDIPVLGSQLQASFIAKKEIADWPFFGWLAKLQRSVFVDRRRSQSSLQRDEIQKRLEAGDDLILFPEGTSGDGNFVLPFKSALFSVAERRVGGEPLVVQPVSISYTRLDDVPMGRYLRPYFAWYGDMDLPSHLWESLGLGLLTVVVEFHEPVTIEALGSRKALADHCHQVVEAGVARAISGRLPAREKRRRRFGRKRASVAAG